MTIEKILNPDPVPPRQSAFVGPIRAAIRDMKPGEAIVLTCAAGERFTGKQNAALNAAKRDGIAITTRKMNGGRLMIWRS